MHVAQLLLQAHGTSYLEVGETINLSGTEQILIKRIDVALLHRLVDVDDVLQLLQEPLVNLSKVVNIKFYDFSFYGICFAQIVGV